MCLSAEVIGADGTSHLTMPPDHDPNTPSDPAPGGACRDARCHQQMQAEAFAELALLLFGLALLLLFALLLRRPPQQVEHVSFTEMHWKRWTRKDEQTGRTSDRASRLCTHQRPAFAPLLLLLVEFTEASALAVRFCPLSAPPTLT